MEIARHEHKRGPFLDPFFIDISIPHKGTTASTSKSDGVMKRKSVIVQVLVKLEMFYSNLVWSTVFVDPFRFQKLEFFPDLVFGLMGSYRDNS